MDLLTRAAKKTAETTPTKKSGPPTIQLPNDENIANAIADWHGAKDAIKSYESMKELQEETLRPVILPLYEKWCLDNKKSESCIYFKMEGQPQISLVKQERYTPIPLDKEQELIDIFQEKYQTSFKKETKITLSAEAMGKIDEIIPQIINGFAGPELVILQKELSEISKEKDKTKLTEKINKLIKEAEEKFLRLMVVTQTITPTTTLHNGMMTDPVLNTLGKKAIECGAIKPTKPYLK